MDPIYYNGDDTREFGPMHDICPDCGADLIDDGHDMSCEYHPNFYEPRDEHDTPIDEEDAA